MQPALTQAEGHHGGEVKALRLQALRQSCVRVFLSSEMSATHLGIRSYVIPFITAASGVQVAACALVGIEHKCRVNTLCK